MSVHPGRRNDSTFEHSDPLGRVASGERHLPPRPTCAHVRHELAPTRARQPAPDDDHQRLWVAFPGEGERRRGRTSPRSRRIRYLPRPKSPGCAAGTGVGSGSSRVCRSRAVDRPSAFSPRGYPRSWREAGEEIQFAGQLFEAGRLTVVRIDQGMVPTLGTVVDLRDPRNGTAQDEPGEPATTRRMPVEGSGRPRWSNEMGRSAASVVAQRAREVEISGICKMFEAAPPGAINLGLGELDFDPPKVVIGALCEAALNGKNHYGSSAGFSALREKVAERYVDRDPQTTKDNVIITRSGTEALMATALALHDPGDEVLVPNPGFVLYAPPRPSRRGDPRPRPLP